MSSPTVGAVSIARIVKPNGSITSNVASRSATGVAGTVLSIMIGIAYASTKRFVLTAALIMRVTLLSVPIFSSASDVS